MARSRWYQEHTSRSLLRPVRLGVERLEPRTLLAGLFGPGLNGLCADNTDLHFQVAEGKSTPAITPQSFARLDPNVAVEKRLTSDNLVYSVNRDMLTSTARKTNSGIASQSLSDFLGNRQSPLSLLPAEGEGPGGILPDATRPAITPFSSARLGNLAALEAQGSAELTHHVNQQMLEIQATQAGAGITVSPVIFGDVNRDRFVTPSDVLLIVNHLNSVNSETYFARGDMNGDQFVTPADVLMIVNLLNGNGESSVAPPLNLLTSFPEGSLVLGIDNGGRTVTAANLVVTDVTGKTVTVLLSGITGTEQRWQVGFHALTGVDLSQVKSIKLTIEGAHTNGILNLHGGDFAIQPTIEMMSPTLTASPASYALATKVKGTLKTYNPTALPALRVPPGAMQEGVNNLAITHFGGNGMKIKAMYQVTVDTVAPSGTVVINQGQAITTSRDVTLTIAGNDATSGVDQMRFSTDGVSWSAWENYTEMKSVTLGEGDGVKEVRLQLKDRAGHVSADIKDTIELITTFTGSLTIANGATYVTSPEVSLSITATDPVSTVTEMRFSNDGVTWQAWEAFAETKNTTLPSADGVKQIHMQLRNALGLVSGTISAAVTLDTTYPIGTIAINTNADFTATTNVTLALTASDVTSGVDQMRFSTDAGATWSAWEMFKTTKSVSLSAGDGLKTVQAEIRDKAGLVSAVLSDAITLDTTGPTGSVVINQGAEYTAARDVNLALTASDAGSGVDQMRFSADGVTWSAWESYAATKALTLPAGEGEKIVRTQLRDKLGNTSATFQDSIRLATTLTGTVVINQGAQFTTALNITLAVSGVSPVSNLESMRFSTDAGSTWSAWENYAATKNLTLSAGDGSKRVMAELRNEAGLISPRFEDTITLDTTKPVGTVTINNNADYTSSASVTLTLTASDATSGVDQMRFSTDLGATWSNWEPFKTTKSISLSAVDGLKTVQAELRDKAGLVSAVLSDTITLDTIAPTGTVVINNNNEFTTTPSVTLTITGNDVGSGLGEMRFSVNNGVTWSAWESYATTKAITLTSGDGPKEVRMQLRDRANVVSPEITDAIILDTVKPTGTITINNGNNFTGSPAVTLQIAGSDATSGLGQMRFSTDSGATWTAWETYATTKSITLSSTEGTKQVTAELKDKAGLVSNLITDTIIVDTSKPTGTVLINNGNQYTASPTVSLAITGADPQSGVTQMRFSTNAGTTWSAWENFAATKSITLPTGEGTKQVQMQLMNGANLISELITGTIILDNVGPTGSIVINGGAAQTTDRRVNVALTGADAGSGLAKMTFSIHGGAPGTWFDVQDFETTKSIKLPQWDGVKEILFKLIDKAGNESIFSDTIILEAEAPQIFVTSPAITNSSGNYTLTYVVDGITKTRQETLNGNGDHTLTITETDPYGKSATIHHLVKIDTGLAIQPRAGVFSIDIDPKFKTGTFPVNELNHSLSKEFLSIYEDDYDQVIFVPTASTAAIIESSTGRRHSWLEKPHSLVKNIGHGIYERRDQFGSTQDGELDNIVIFNSAFWDPKRPLSNIYLRTVYEWLILHETGHQWLSKITAPEGNPLGLVDATGHWSPFLNLEKSPIHGYHWNDNGDGTFTLHHGNLDYWTQHLGEIFQFSDLGLYIMGLMAPEEVAPVWVIDEPALSDGRKLITEGSLTYAVNPDGTRERKDLFADDVIVGTRRDVTIEQVLSVAGRRSQSWLEAPKDFSFAFVVVRAPDQDQVELRQLVEKVNDFTNRMPLIWETGTSNRAGLDLIPVQSSDRLPPEVEFTSPVTSTSSNYTLVYTVDGVEKREIVILSAGKNVLVREATGANGKRRVASFVVERVSGLSGVAALQGSATFISEGEAKLATPTVIGATPPFPAFSDDDGAATTDAIHDDESAALDQNMPKKTPTQSIAFPDLPTTSRFNQAFQSEPLHLDQLAALRDKIAEVTEISPAMRLDLLRVKKSQFGLINSQTAARIRVAASHDAALQQGPEELEQLTSTLETPLHASLSSNLANALTQVRFFGNRRTQHPE